MTFPTTYQRLRNLKYQNIKAAYHRWVAPQEYFHPLYVNFLSISWKNIFRGDRGSKIEKNNEEKCIVFRFLQLSIYYQSILPIFAIFHIIKKKIVLRRGGQETKNLEKLDNGNMGIKI